MIAYTVFDDFPPQAISMLHNRGIEVVVHPLGQPRPFGDELKQLLRQYDIIFVSTAQKMGPEMFADINTPKVIATASSGTDHINVPADKASIIRIANAPNANRTTVAEHTFSLVLALRKQLVEARAVAAQGKTKKAMHGQLHDLYGATIGVIGAGGIASKVLMLAKAFGMQCLCWTFNPEKHQDLCDEGVTFTSLDYLCSHSDVISVNIPSSEKTAQLVDKRLVAMMKDNAVFVTTSRTNVTDVSSLIEKAYHFDSFGLGMDVDSQEVSGKWGDEHHNIIITPHIGGGTIESRIRLFNECCENAISLLDAEK